MAGRIDGAQAWSPQQPTLYTANVELLAGGEAIDQQTSRFGFRKIEVRDGRLVLNGQEIVLCGFNRHEDSPRTDMCTNLETARADLLDMRSLGCNFVRLCHYPHHPGEIDLCDELGLLVMGEIPLYWWDGLAEGEANCAAKLAAAKRQLTSMIARDRNHPSVILWSVSNETKEERPEVVAGNIELIELARRLDTTRLAVHVSVHWWEHPHFEADDVICVNAYPTWSGRKKGPDYDLAESQQFWRDELAKLHELYPGKPILVSEFGYPGLSGFRDGATGEDMQAAAIAAEFEAMKAPYVCGWTIWCYADHAWPGKGSGGGVSVSPFGVVSRARQRTRSHAVVAEMFGGSGL